LKTGEKQSFYRLQIDIGNSPQKRTQSRKNAKFRKGILPKVVLDDNKFEKVLL